MEQNSSQRGGVISQYSVSNVNEYVENADNNLFHLMEPSNAFCYDYERIICTSYPLDLDISLP